MNIVDRSFYSRDALTVAKELLSCVIVRKIGRKEIRARIIDVEAYIGEDDLACHASKGRTSRSEILYGEPGHAYVYLIYGMYYIFNVVVERKDFPAGIMVRAVHVEGVDQKKTNGPGKVCKMLAIDKSCNGVDLTEGKKLWIEYGEKIQPRDIGVLKRVGIDYAQHCAHYPWRFHIKNPK